MGMSRLVPASAVALTFLALSSPGLGAQQGLELGFRAGVSVASASLDVSQTLSKDNRTGFAGGIFLNYDASLLGIQLGAEYTQKGVDLDIEGAIHNLSLNYLEIPAVVKLGLPLGVLKPSVFGGVGVGFKTSCDDDGVDCGGDFKGTDFSGIAGADVAIYLSSLSLWADGRYHFGLNDISKAGDVVSDLKNRNWTFQVGIGFRIGH